MRKISTLAIIVCTAALLSSLDSFARKITPFQGGKGWGVQGAYNRLYNAHSVETLRGVVVSTGTVEPMTGMGPGIELLLQTDAGTVSVHLGPEWYVNNQDKRLVVRDHLEIKGSRVTCEGKAVIMASQVARGIELFTLRDEQGRPVWDGWTPRM